MPDSSRPRSRRERPAKPALTRDGIIAAAVRIMEAEGLQRVTMRRLAQELDTGPASLYVYVANTAELHAAILEKLLGEVDLSPVTADGDWRERIDTVLTSYIEVLFVHPSLAHSALIARPHGPNYLDLVEALLALLAEGGVPDAQAAWGVDILLLAATATAAEHAAQDRSPDAAEDWTATVEALRHASPDRQPHIAALASELVAGSPEARHAWTFRALLHGIQHTPRPQ